MTYSFHPEAEEELDRAVDYYEAYSPGLGMEFADEIYATIQRIIRFPEAWSQFCRGTRRCLARRFPFGVIYHVDGDAIIVIAVMQLNRRPNHWIELMHRLHWLFLSVRPEWRTHFGVEVPTAGSGNPHVGH